MLKTYSLTYQYTIGLIKVRKKGSTSRIHGFRNQEYAKILTHRSTRCIYWRSMLIFSQWALCWLQIWEVTHRLWKSTNRTSSVVFFFRNVINVSISRVFTGDQGWKVCMRCTSTWWMVVVRDVKSSLGSIPTNSLTLWARCSYIYAHTCLPLTAMRIYICTHY